MNTRPVPGSPSLTTDVPRDDGERRVAVFLDVAGNRRDLPGAAAGPRATLNT